jgi:redox-sensitive bicupin YhaK (pirin superfamily)
MITIRRSSERGHLNFGWLDTYHTFSFGEYFDPAWMGYRSLRVINEDVVAGGAGFPPHPHRDMEILTWIIDGQLEHKDSTGGGGIIRPGDLQHMSAGRGVRHSEFNPSETEACHLLQIWLLPAEQGIEPGYDQHTYADADLRAGLKLVASPDGADGSLVIRQDASLYASRPAAGSQLNHSFAEGRAGWVQVSRGAVTLNGEALRAGDGAALEGEREIVINATQDSELLLFDLA